MASSPLASARSSLALASCVRMAASSGSLGRRLTGRCEPTLAPSARSHARRAACLFCWVYSSRSNLLVFRVAPPPPGSIHRPARVHTSADPRQSLARQHRVVLHGDCISWLVFCEFTCLPARGEQNTRMRSAGSSDAGFPFLPWRRGTPRSDSLSTVPLRG